jgi:OmpA-OmpF porin, OOP family
VSRRVLLLSLLAVSAAGCATGGKLRSASDVVQSDVEKAKRSGATTCAPRELALAEANVDFARAEMRQADPSRAGAHLKIAEANVRKALELSRTCGPTQVLIREKKLTEVPLPPPPTPRVQIEKTDGDKDGVPDLDDKCPEVPGKPEFQGCPDTDGDGVPDAEDACPNQPGGKDAQGCPVAKDTDRDGTPDDIDRCPLDAEDKDGFQDEDGCPDSDNDQDGVVDRMDTCPNDAGPIVNRGCPVLDGDGDGVPDPQDKCPVNAGSRENEGCPDLDRDRDGFADRLDKCPEDPGVHPDGCPKKYTLVEVKKDRIDIKQQVHFATGKSMVRPDSRALLNQVVQVLNDYPKMRVSIQGHTDSQGGEALNMRLSQERAEAVREYLVEKGVAPERLEALGYGPTKPIATNRTAKGRSLNRRTEFRIVAME